MIPYKNILVKSLNSKDFSSLDFFTYEIPHTAPVAMCMLTTPPFLFSGKPINTSSDPDYKFSDILTSVIPLSDRTLIILAAFKNDPHGSEYLDELDSMPNLSLEKALSWHIITSSENCFFSPKWYDNLPTKKKSYIIELTSFVASLTTPFLEYDPKHFDLNFLNRKYAI